MTAFTGLATGIAIYINDENKQLFKKLFLYGTAILLSAFVIALVTSGAINYAKDVLLLKTFELLSLSIPFGYAAVLASLVQYLLIKIKG